MIYILGIAMLVLITACTLIQVDVSSDDEGTTTVQPNGINITVPKEEKP